MKISEILTFSETQLQRLFFLTLIEIFKSKLAIMLFFYSTDDLQILFFKRIFHGKLFTLQNKNLCNKCLVYQLIVKNFN